jgi:hypothetical protein
MTLGPLGFVLAALLWGCGDPRLDAPLTDAFDHGLDAYRSAGAPYRVESGHVVAEGVHNHPLWLRRRLPERVRVEFDATARSQDGDIKVEIAGDGTTHQSEEAVRKDLVYVASGYVLIFGGWRNNVSVIARQDEHGWQHGANVPVRRVPRVIPGRPYHFVIELAPGHLTWAIDGQPFLAFEDPSPLTGKGHDHFGFSGWESRVEFDNLLITPLSR